MDELGRCLLQGIFWVLCVFEHFMVPYLKTGRFIVEITSLGVYESMLAMAQWGHMLGGLELLEVSYV
jgi:hypothetical protein